MIPYIVACRSSIMTLFLQFRQILRQIIENLSSISLISIFKIFTTIVFTYQSILLSIDYLNYEVVTDIKLSKIDYEHNPAISICIKTEHEILRFNSERTENSTISEYFGKMLCLISSNKGKKSIKIFSNRSALFLIQRSLINSQKHFKLITLKY